MSPNPDTGRERFPEGCVKACPACPHRHMTAGESLQVKGQWLKERLAPFAAVIRPVASVAEKERLHYRDKVCLAAERETGGWKVGIRNRGAVLPVPDCPVHSGRVNRSLKAMLPLFRDLPEFPLVYYVQTGSQLALVLKTGRMPDAVPWQDWYASTLVPSGLEGLWVHLFPSAGKKVFGKGGWHLVAGRPWSFDEDGLRYGPAAFQQLLPSLYRQAMEQAVRFLGPGPEDQLADLYCGTGSSLRRWTAGRVIGVEVSGDALFHAAVNAPGHTVLRGTVTQRIPQLREWEGLTRKGDRNLLYANPPRTGLEPACLEWILSSFRPARFAYLSCSAGTLRRDLDALTGRGYRVDSILPFDFFPLTRHVETLVLLQRQP